MVHNGSNQNEELKRAFNEESDGASPFLMLNSNQDYNSQIQSPIRRRTSIKEMPLDQYCDPLDSSEPNDDNEGGYVLSKTMLLGPHSYMS